MANFVFALDGMFAGAGMEVNANTRNGAALGGVLIAGVELNHQFASGLKVTISHNLEETAALELQPFFRYNLPFGAGFFAQAELGVSVFFEDGESYPAFMGGAAFGWRYVITKNYYVEPYVRAGYPFIWGIGLTAGMKFPLGGNK